jgi:hypothetical protein
LITTPSSPAICHALRRNRIRPLDFGYLAGAAMLKPNQAGADRGVILVSSVIQFDAARVEDQAGKLSEF